MGDFHQDILAPSAMALIHDAVVARFGSFEHVGRFSRYRSYQTEGIQPRDPDKDNDGSETHAEPVGIILARVVCLRPIGTFNSAPNRGERQFRMAISNRDLPPSIGLDWSHGFAMNLASVLQTDNPNWSNSDIFIEVARRLGTLVSYSPLAPSVIRVRTNDCDANNPESWPLLIDTEESQVYSF
jgi:hypothetical protein